MLTRALILLCLVASVSVGLSWWFGAEVLAALGLMLTQAKLIAGKLFAVSSKGLIVWLKAQGVNFARVELAKRWFLKSLLPLLIGAATQRRILAFVTELKLRFKARYAAMMEWYRGLPRAVKVIAVLIVMFATLALAVTTMSLWLLIFSIQLPMWIIAGVSAFGGMLWKYVQKLAFRTIAFLHLYQVWGWLKRRIPPEYLARKRRFDFRVARMVVKKRRMTLAQVRSGKNGMAMRWALLKGYFQTARPEAPTEDEMAANSRRRKETPAE